MTTRDALAELSYECERVRDDDTLAQVGSSAYRLGQLVASGSLDAAEVIEALFNAACEREDANPDVVYMLIKQGIKAGLQIPATPRVEPAIRHVLL